MVETMKPFIRSFIHTVHFGKCYKLLQSLVDYVHTVSNIIYQDEQSSN